MRQGDIRLRIADDKWKMSSRRTLRVRLRRTNVWLEISSRILHVPDKWREAVVWNCSCVDALKGTVLHRTVPRDRVNGKLIRTY